VRAQFDYNEQVLRGFWQAAAGNEPGSRDAFAKARTLIDALHALDANAIAAANAKSQLTAVEAVVLTEHFPGWTNFVREWSVLGPLPNKYGDGDFHEEMFPSAWFASKVRIDEPATLADGRRLPWKTYRSPGAMINFSKAFPVEGDPSSLPLRAAYAGIELEVPAARSVMFRLDSFHHYRLYLNGKELFHRESWQSPHPDRQAVKADLNAGKNELILRSAQMVSEQPGAWWGFWFRVTDENYELIKDLRVRPLR
jgi:hypothetical protein